MLDVIIALTPALIAATVIFGGRALLLTAVCVASCVVFEWLMCLLLKKDNTSGISAPPSPVCFSPSPAGGTARVDGDHRLLCVHRYSVKCFFGGIGQNFANPALVGRIVLFVSFSGAMTTWVKPFAYQYGLADAMTTATPLASSGRAAGRISRSCSWAPPAAAGRNLRPGAALRRRLSGRSPGDQPGGTPDLYRHRGGGGGPRLPDRQASHCLDQPGFHPVSRAQRRSAAGGDFHGDGLRHHPATRWGKVIFGFGCGLITIVIRLFGSYTEGVSFAILL